MALHIEVFKKSNYSITDTCGFLIYQNQDIDKINYLAFCFDYDTCIRNKLKESVLEQIRMGCTHFIIQLDYMISGVIADIISQLTEDYPQIILEVFTSKSELEKYTDSDGVLSKCSKITVLRKNNDTKSKRFEKIVSVSGYIIYASNIVGCQYNRCNAIRNRQT